MLLCFLCVMAQVQGGLVSREGERTRAREELDFVVVVIVIVVFFYHLLIVRLHFVRGGSGSAIGSACSRLV
jgi:hypothetical protein